MNSQSWKRLFTPNIRSKPDSKISILGNKTIIRPKKRKDIENDFQWRTDTELSDLSDKHHPNEAWLKFDSSFATDDYTYDDDWLDGAKGTIKLAYKKQRQEAIKKGVSYNLSLIHISEPTRPY